MPLEIPVAFAALACVIAYGVLAGADFGGGVWTLFAGGPRKSAQRDAIARVMAPVWEANHVWLIFLIVILFAGFPPAFAALGVGLFAPFHLALVGITLRGAAFVFRAYGPKNLAVRWGTLFGAASVVTPVLLGMSLGAVSAGGLRFAAPISLTMGALALALCAYLAAVFLTIDTDGPLREDFRTRALVTGGAVVALSVVAVPFMHLDAPHLASGLFAPRAAPVLVLGGVAALLSGYALLVRRFKLARAATIAQVTLLLAGWGLAQYPYIVYPDHTLFSAAAPRPTLVFLLGSLPFGAALLGPSLWFLFRVFRRTPST